MNTEISLWTTIPAFYAENLRSILFSGLLTVGAFLFAVKTFIVVKIKEEIFDAPFYKDRIDQFRKRNPGKHVEHYGPLRRLTTVLFYASVTAIASAIVQLSLGLFKTPLASVVCLLAAFVSIALLIASLILVKINLNVWMQEIERQKAFQPSPPSP